MTLLRMGNPPPSAPASGLASETCQHLGAIRALLGVALPRGQVGDGVALTAPPWRPLARRPDCVHRPPDAVAEPSGWRPAGPCPITPAPSLSMLPVVAAHCPSSLSSSGFPILSGTARVEQKPSSVGRGQCRRIHLVSKPGDSLCLFFFTDISAHSHPSYIC